MPDTISGSDSHEAVPKHDDISVRASSALPKRSLVSFAVLVIVAALGLVVGASAAVLGYPHFHSTPGVTSKASTNQISSSPSNETFTQKLRIDYTPYLGASSQVKLMAISLTAPTAIRTQITNTSCLGGPQASYLDECLHLSFADRLGSGDSNIAAGSVSLWEATSWLQRDEPSDRGIYQFDLSTAAEKKKAWQALTSLTPSTKLTNAVLGSLPSLAVDAAYVDGVQGATFVQSADGSLKGVAFLATEAQDQEYDPYVWFEMGGTVDGLPFLLTGHLRASDPMANTIQALLLQYTQSAQNQAEPLVEQAGKQFAAGNVPPQTKQSLSDVIQILQSIKLSAQ